jgi:hypothetical protein
LIGNVLRHDYESIAAPVLWKLVRADLPDIGKSLPLGTGREKRLLGSALPAKTGADGSNLIDVAKLWLVSRFAYSFSSRICPPL